MEELYQDIRKLTAEQQKLLCFLAYSGLSTGHQAFTAYALSERLTTARIKDVISSLMSYFDTETAHYYDDYHLHPHHHGRLLVYLICERPDLIRTYSHSYKKHQTPYLATLIDSLRLCVMGRYDTGNRLVNDVRMARTLVALVCYRQFHSFLKSFAPDIAATLVSDALCYQLEYDIEDPDDATEALATQIGTRLSAEARNTLLTSVALCQYYRQGTYNAQAAALDTVCAHILCGLHALYAANYETAFKQLSAALRSYSRAMPSQQKGIFRFALDNFAMVMAYHFHEHDDHRKLTALMKRELFADHLRQFAPYWFGSYLNDGTLPSTAAIRTSLSSHQTIRPLYQYLTMLTARFFDIDIDWPENLPAIPRQRMLRHEMAAWLPIDKEERRHLESDFGGSPLLKRIRYQAPWERLLEELTPKEPDKSVQTVRIAYIINNGRVEVREQRCTKTGEWGAGRHMTLEAFHKGTDFMDATDHDIAAVIRSWYSDFIDASIILPRLVGSNRVYHGNTPPYEPVTIDEEKPYLVIQRTAAGFCVKSNLPKGKADSEAIYVKHDDTHYTVIRLTLQQRLYYKKLLDVGTFPHEAEPLLRQFLPKISSIVEVHSDLVEGGSTLPRRDGSPVLCLQVSPAAGASKVFSVGCYARPLPDGMTLFQPGTGINPCVAEADGTRYQVTRDMRGERENLLLLRTFIDDNNLADDSILEPFAEHHPLCLSAESLLQLMLFVKEQPEHFFMEWPEGRQLTLKTSDTSSWNIGLKSKNGWFEVEGEIPIDEDTVLTVAQLLQLIGESRQKGFVRLADGQFLAITERLQKQLARLESLTTTNRGHLVINEMHAALLGSTLSGEIDIRHDKKIMQLQDKIERSMALEVQMPKALKAELRDYQLDGFQWLCRMTGWGAGVCLADDMGLGKTVQAIAFMLHTQDDGASLVAAPASVVLNWRHELERFAPSLNVIVLNIQPDRQAAIQQAKQGDIVLTTYGLFVTEAKQLQRKEWNTVCLDEAHVIKNRETKTSQAVMKLQAKHRVILTGTPVQNHLGELWNLYQFINPGLLGSYDQFSEKYIQPIEQFDDKERSRQLRRIIQPFILRRTKQEVVEELPDKTEINLSVELSQDEMAVYEVIRRRAKNLLEEDGGGNPSINTLAEITRLRQAACAPQLAEKTWVGGDSTKIAILMQLLEEIVGGGNSALVFSQFTSFLALIRQALDRLKIDYAYLDGSVSMRQRDQLVNDFQRGRQQVFLISLKAGGVGLNLTGANYVIHLDPWWNPAIEQQATDRAYRIGQRQNVTVYHLIAQHTIEEKILRMHETKRNLADGMLNGTSQSHKLTAKDLLQMIEP